MGRGVFNSTTPAQTLLQHGSDGTGAGPGGLQPGSHGTGASPDGLQQDADGTGAGPGVLQNGSDGTGASPGGLQQHADGTGTSPGVLQHNSDGADLDTGPCSSPDHLRDLPPSMVDLGKQIFGDCEKWLAVAAQISRATPIKIVSYNLLLRALTTDDTLRRIQREWKVDQYEFLLVPVDEPGVIVDIGANIGDSCLCAARMHPRRQVVCVEPHPVTYFLLHSNLVLNGVPLLTPSDLGKPGVSGVLPIRAAVGDKGGAVQLTVNLVKKSSQTARVVSFTSGVMSKTEKASSSDPISVPCLDLVSFLVEHGVQSIPMLKMDCEGCEFVVVPKLALMLADHDRVKRWRGEIHWSLQPTKEQKDAVLQVFQQRGCERVISHGCCEPIKC